MFFRFSKMEEVLFCLFLVVRGDDEAVGEGDLAVGHGGKVLVVGDDDEGLFEFVAEAEE